MRILMTIALTFALAACSGDDSTDTASGTIAAAVRPVHCGCHIDSIGKCGNYIEIDGSPLEIANGTELGLGSMEWCSRPEGATADSAGHIEDGKFVATTFLERKGD